MKKCSALQTTATTMRQQLEQHRKASATLKANISTLESKVAETLNKKETLKARAASAQVKLCRCMCPENLLPLVFVQNPQ